MIEKDYLIKAVDSNRHVNVLVASSTLVVEEARRRHHTSATASAALGRLLTAALIMGSQLKADDDSITLKLEGNGPAGTLIATADSHGRVRGLIGVPEADLPSSQPGKLAVGDLVGSDGYLEVIRDMGLKQPFAGRTRLVSGEVAEDLAHYFLMSEQIPSLVSLGVLVAPDLSIQAAGGLLVQASPGADEMILDRIEQNTLQLGAISQAVYQHSSLEQILDQLMEGIDYEIGDIMPLEFQCTCSHERLARILAGLPGEDMDELFSDEQIEVCCNFCNEKYHFAPGEIISLKSEKP